MSPNVLDSSYSKHKKNRGLAEIWTMPNSSYVTTKQEQISDSSVFNAKLYL